jgi:tetrahydromethanopterin S-methyltransferase subunit B
VVASLTNVIAGFLIGLGIYSLMRVHLSKIAKQQKDWAFSAVLVGSMVVMVVFGFWDYFMRLDPKNFALADQKNWGFINYGRDLLFDGLLQNMDAGMFSIVAFYIMSAAYRAFRARSVEATILLLTALLVILSLMGVVELLWSDVVDKVSPSNPALHSMVQSLKLSSMSSWLRSNVQTSAIRGIDFGVGIGLLAMGLRLWLSLEKTGGDS